MKTTMRVLRNIIKEEVKASSKRRVNEADDSEEFEIAVKAAVAYIVLQDPDFAEDALEEIRQEVLRRGDRMMGR